MPKAKLTKFITVDIELISKEFNESCPQCQYVSGMQRENEREKTTSPIVGA